MGAESSPVIVYEDNHVLVVNKPVLLATMGTAAGERSLARDLQAELKRKYHKPGNVYLGIVSRLDTVTSGLIVFAKTSKAAGRLTTQFQLRQVEKWYLAAVPSVPSRWTNSGTRLALASHTNAANAANKGAAGGSTDADADSGLGRWAVLSRWVDGRWLDQVWKDDQAHRMRCEVGGAEGHASWVGGEETEGSGPKGRVAAGLEWRFLGRGSDYDLVAVRLLTGRKHQIRVQFAARGLPILGDRKYGSSVDFPAGIALHAWRLTLAHPVTRQTLSFVQGPPAAWRTLPACLPAADLADIPAGDGGRVNQKPALNPVELVRWLMEAEPGADR